MWKWLVLGLAVYVLYRLFANDFLKKKKENAEDQAAEVERFALICVVGVARGQRRQPGEPYSKKDMFSFVHRGGKP